MKIFKWISGRQQNIEYFKFCIYSFKFFNWGFDCYLLKYPKPCFLKFHTDPVKGGIHYRLNIKLLGTCKFYCIKEFLEIGETIHLFDAHKYLHALVVKSKVLKLSFGAAKIK